MTIKIELTEQEAVALRNILDIAVRHSGMSVAEFAIVMDRRIMAAHLQSQQAKQELQPDQPDKQKVNGAPNLPPKRGHTVESKDAKA